MSIQDWPGWLLAGLVTLVAAGPARASAPSPATELAPSEIETEAEASVTLRDATLHDLIRHAESHSPRLRSIRAEHAAAREAVTLASAFPDPRLTVNLAVEPIETRVGPQQGQVLLSQGLPGRGKRSARAAEASAESDHVAQRLELEQRRLAHDVAVAYYDYYLLNRSLEVTRDNRDLLVYLEEIVRTSYETGRTPYADLIREQVEIGRLENDVRSLQDRIRPARARLNALLSRPDAAPLPSPTVDSGPLSLLPDDELQAMVAARSPKLAVADARIARRERSVDVALLDTRPDWSLSVGYMPTGAARMPGVPDSGDDPLTVGFSVSLPVWRGRYRASTRRAQELRVAEQAARDATADEIRDQVAWALYEFRNAEREVDLYGDTLLPKAIQSLEASQAGLRAGTTGVLDVVDAQRVLLSFQLAHERALAARARAVAALRLLAGGEVLAEQASPGGMS